MNAIKGLHGHISCKKAAVYMLGSKMLGKAPAMLKQHGFNLPYQITVRHVLTEPARKICQGSPFAFVLKACNREIEKQS